MNLSAVYRCAGCKSTAALSRAFRKSLPNHDPHPLAATRPQVPAFHLHLRLAANCLHYGFLPDISPAYRLIARCRVPGAGTAHSPHIRRASPPAVTGQDAVPHLREPAFQSRTPPGLAAQPARSHLPALFPGGMFRHPGFELFAALLVIFEQVETRTGRG